MRPFTVAAFDRATTVNPATKLLTLQGSLRWKAFHFESSYFLN
jgi:hypothetical protein